MSKEDIFSKIQIKDYNNVLENVLESKDFSEDVKNLLLSMLYKIENGFEDYKTIKVNVTSKKYFLKNIVQIIDKECKEIHFVKPLSDESKELEEKNVDYIVEDGKIKVYQNERMLLEALITLGQKNIYIDEKYKLYEKAIRDVLIFGNTMSNSEVIRDFNGWSWGITPSQLKNVNINIIYQNLLMLFGNSFMQKWITDNEENEDVDIDLPNNVILRSKYNNNFGMTKEEIQKANKIDYIGKMKKILTDKCGEENTKEFFENLLKSIIAVGVNIDQKQKKNIMEKQENTQKQLEKMQDNRKYLEDLSKVKKELNQKIREIDKILSNKNLLEEEYETRNAKLPNKEKIFSVSHLVIMLEKEREKYIKEIKENNKRMEPNEFVKNKQELEEQNKFFNDINIKKDKQTDENIQVEELQKSFLKCMEEITKRAKEKDEIEKLLYEIRYYENIPYNSRNLSSVESTKKLIEIIEREIVKKACKFKILTTISGDEKLNYEVLKNVFKSKIANLKNTIYVLKYNKGVLKVLIYDTNIEEEVKEVKITEKVELSVKLNKKIKVYE